MNKFLNDYFTLNLVYIALSFIPPFVILSNFLTIILALKPLSILWATIAPFFIWIYLIL